VKLVTKAGIAEILMLVDESLKLDDISVTPLSAAHEDEISVSAYERYKSHDLAANTAVPDVTEDAHVGSTPADLPDVVQT
jgi:hypothetical protein